MNLELEGIIMVIYSNAPHFADVKTEAWRRLSDLPIVTKALRAKVQTLVSQPQVQGSL